MYIPGHFTLSEEHIHKILTRPRRGNLVTVHAFGPEASLVPFYLDEERGTLVTHLVRNNPQVREPVIGPGLVILDDVDAYISPLWYATNNSKANVPTWDYVTVHVRGQVRVDPDPQAALRVARRLTALYEQTDVLEPVGDAALQRMARAIVAVEVSLEEVRGKAKMSQNRHPEDLKSLAHELEQQGQTAMAEFLRTVSLPYAEARFRKLAELGRTERGRAVAATRAQ
ncbi:Protease synthase and sporulation protein PAI 2 [Actinomyces bovis]|uniref:Protease synthase and sporulation protein PAI 2 n=1 Tax=Actinomyces bovis TaxID=1658 RepID=A0ABY1VPS0_9ACTO|nr:FMN-binding negative transcriptional regulator [Actinomyces bovis]SPT54055.1 Protease synthase and sporulation protein PAI 2 [Actinomyces bovis]VEG53768.1 Protease synthase and sporulation protein PAI 2 [Actinomyces israelii]